MTNVPARDLAVALGISIPELLTRADRAIEQLHRDGGLEAARGYSTERGPQGTVTITEPLAVLLREQAKSN